MDPFWAGFVVGGIFAVVLLIILMEVVERLAERRRQRTCPDYIPVEVLLDDQDAK